MNKASQVKMFESQGKEIYIVKRVFFHQYKIIRHSNANREKNYKSIKPTNLQQQDKMEKYVGDGGAHHEDDDEYGPTTELHKGALGVIWGPAANVAIVLAYYGYRKVWAYVHGSFFLFAIIITLASSIPIITTVGVIQSKNSLSAHFIIGIICFSAATAVGILGILTKLLNLCQAKSNTILMIKKLHLITGYVVAGICKINIYIVSVAWIAQDIAFLVIFIVWKLYFPKMEGKHISPKDQKNTCVQGIKSIKELDPEKSYVVFANFVYDAEPLKYHHPAGYQIVDMVKNRDVDRFIYGTEVAAELPEVPQWSHTYKSFTLMDAPVAKLTIEPTFQGFDAPQVECNIPEVRLISEKGSIYQLNLTKKEGTFTFLKYKNITQIGRYFSITLNDKVTRLYTTVNFLVAENLVFLQKHLQLSGIYGKIVKVQQKPIKQLGPQTVEGINEKKIVEIQMKDSSRINLSETANSIPILFKFYPGGKFTGGIVNGPIEKVVLSESKGEGLELAHTKPGKIIMVIGGTGLYPFSDLIDLLFKEQLIMKDPSAKNEIFDLSPILFSNPFAGFTFDVLAAFGHLEDLHPITLQQLLFLTETGRIHLTLKLKENPMEKIRENSHLSFSNSDFQALLQEKLEKKDISKVWICGPPKMNQGVSKFLRDTYGNPEQYLIV